MFDQGKKHMHKSKYHFTATIVTYCNDMEVLKKAMDSFLITSLNVKLYIVDNSPTDEVSTLCTDRRIEYLANNANLGFGVAHNKILSQYEKLGDFHIILNPDIFFEKGVLESIYDYMIANDEIGLLIPKVLYPDGRHQYLPKLFPSPIDLFIRRFPFPNSIKKRFNDAYELRFADYSQPFDIPIVSGCFSVVKSAVIREGIKYDERFFMYFEDFDFSRRILKKHKVICYPLAEVFHNYERGSHNNFRLLVIFLLSMIKYFNKWGWFFDQERKIINTEAIIRNKKYPSQQ